MRLDVDTSVNPPELVASRQRTDKGAIRYYDDCIHVVTSVERLIRLITRMLQKAAREAVIAG